MKTRSAAAEIIYLHRPDGAFVDPSDKRQATRRKVLKSAIAAYHDRHCTVACVVRDISATGARLRVESSVDVPDTFELIIELDGLEAKCKVVWRLQKELGIQFIGAPRKAEPKRTQIVSEASVLARPTIRRKAVSGTAT